MNPDLDKTPTLRRYIEAVGGSLSFKIGGLPPDISPERALDQNLVRAALVIPPHFERDLKRGQRAELQWLIDGTDANTANIMRGKASAITQSFSAQIQPAVAEIAIQPQIRYWFNPGREDLKYFGPGVLAFGLALFPPLLAALAVSREGELKTILQVYVSSITAFEYLLGKVIAYTIVAWAESQRRFLSQKQPSLNASSAQNGRSKKPASRMKFLHPIDYPNVWYQFKP